MIFGEGWESTGWPSWRNSCRRAGTLITEGSTAAFRRLWRRDRRDGGASGAIVRARVDQARADYNMKSPIADGFDAKICRVLQQDPVFTGRRIRQRLGGAALLGSARTSRPTGAGSDFAAWTRFDLRRLCRLRSPVDDQACRCVNRCARSDSLKMLSRVVIQFGESERHAVSGRLRVAGAFESPIALDVTVARAHRYVRRYGRSGGGQTQGTYFLGFNAILIGIIWTRVSRSRSRGSAEPQ